MKNSKHTPTDYSEASHIDEVMEVIINENGTKALETIVNHAMDKNVPYFASKTHSSKLNNLYYKPR